MRQIRLLIGCAIGMRTSKRERRLTQTIGVFLLLILMVLTGSGAWVQAVKSYPPIVPHGEKIDDIRDLIKNISRYSDVNSVAFSPDGKILASGYGNIILSSGENTIRLWDVNSGKEIQRLEGHTRAVNSVAFSPDGKTLASGSYDETVRLWAVSSGKEIQRLEGHTHSVTSVAFSPDGKTLASGSYDGTVRLWAVSSGKEIRRLEGHTIRVISVAFSPDGKTLASGSYDKTVRLWAVSSGKEIQRLEGHMMVVTSVAFSPDGKTLASGSWDSTLRLWDVSSGKEIQRLEGHTSDVTSVAFSPDGKTLASGSGGLLFHSRDNSIRLWAVSNGKEIQRLEGHTMVVTSVAFSPDGKTLASGSRDSSVRLWAESSGKESQRLEGHTSAVYSVAFSLDGRILASGSDDNIVRLWAVSSGKEIQRLGGHTNLVISVAFSPDGKTLASGSRDESVRLWDVSSGKEIRHLEGHTGFVWSVAFSQDGKILASGSDDSTVRLWDVSSGKEIQRLAVDIFPVSSVAFSSDGKTLAANLFWKNIRIWDMTTHKQIKQIPANRENWQIYFNTNRTSHGGKTIISLSEDRRAIQLRRVTDGKLLWTFINSQKGNWLSINGENLVWRYDDGSFLVKKSESGLIKPIKPPPPRSFENIRFSILEKPQKLETYDGEAAEFTMVIKNTGTENLYWLNVVRQKGESPGEKNPLVFHPPAPQITLEPDKIASFTCHVSAASPYTNPGEQSAALHLKITSAYGAPVSLEIPVNLHVPHLELRKAAIQKQEKAVLLVTLQNTGHQDLSTGIEFRGTIGVLSLYTATESIKKGEIADISFALPDKFQLNNDLRLDLVARKPNHPVHEWIFENQAVSLPPPAWYWYGIFGLLALVVLAGLYYVRLYLNPLVTQLSKSPLELLHLEPHGLERAQKLLARTHRLETVLSGAGVSKSRLEKTLDFYHHNNPERQLNILAQQLDASLEPSLEINTPPQDIHLFKLRLSSDFMLNLDRCFLAFPAAGLSAHDILKNLKQVEILNYRVCILIALDETQQAALRKESLKTENLLVTPSYKELTHLLLCPDPQTALARLIALQVKLTQVSPYHIKGGIDRESIFFGRKQLLAQIMQRNPANYFLVGGRQLGKTSLLKAILRRYHESPLVQCQYLLLTSETIAPHLARELRLREDMD
ncbi:MAG: hypothetical protein JSV88_04545, partial [Candidatus Aminicenantes bacterium]